MRFVGNIIYLLTGGALLSAAWASAALFFWVLVVTRPLARACLQVAALCLSPAGREIIRAEQVEAYRSYIRTGFLPQRRRLSLSFCGTRCLETLLWLPVGLCLMCGHFLHAGLMVIPVWTNNWARQDMDLAGIALFPFGARLASDGQARIARHVASSRAVRERRQHWTVAARSLTAASTAIFILWVPSDHEANAPRAAAYPAASIPRAERPLADVAGIGFTNFDAPSGRPLAGPPPLAAASRQENAPQPAAEDCAGPQQLLTLRLSRRNAIYGEPPLGSGRVASGFGVRDFDMARHVFNIEGWIAKASFWYAKAPAPDLCRSAIEKRIAKASPMPVTRKAKAAMAVVERTGKGALYARAKSVGPLILNTGLLMSGAKRPGAPMALAEAASPALTLH